jgi:hypothetical protein
LLGVILKIGDDLHAQCFVLIQISRHAGDAPLDLWQRHDKPHGHDRLSRGILSMSLLQGGDQVFDVDEVSNLPFR